MKSTILKASALACLLVSLSASAVPVSTIYAGGTSADSYVFTLPTLSTVSIGYSWSDMVLIKNGDHRYYDATSLQWSLSGTSFDAGTLTDDKSVIAANGQLYLGDLGPGTYQLSLSGTWSSVTLPGIGNRNFSNTPGSVDLIDGDAMGNITESNTFSAIPVPIVDLQVSDSSSAVPEPESAVILLTSLGIMAALRRKKIGQVR
jgi:hypothetical protein